MNADALINGALCLGVLALIGAGFYGLIRRGWPKPDPEGDAAEDLGRVPGGDEQ
jgi:hypothetical protein